MTSLHHTASSLTTTSSSDGLTIWLVLAGLVLLAGYLAACAIWPFAACRRCGGSGKKRSPSGRAWRLCRHCKATGARVRPGRRVVTVIRRTHRAGTRGTRKRTTSWRKSSQ